MHYSSASKSIQFIKTCGCNPCMTTGVWIHCYWPTVIPLSGETIHKIMSFVRKYAFGSHSPYPFFTPNKRKIQCFFNYHITGYTDLLGVDQFSLGWDIPSRELLYNGQIVGRYSDGLPVPKSIHMIVDLTAKEVWFNVDSGEENLKPCPHITGKSLFSCQP